MASKSYNPYKIKVEAINRFRGVINPENQQTMSKEYVGSSDNAISFRVGELTGREGQEKNSFDPTGAVHTGKRLTSMVCLSTGGDVFAEAASGLLKTADIDFISAIPVFTFIFPSTKLCSDLWASNPGFSEYEDAANAAVPAYSTNNPLGLCWNIPSGGGGGGGLPDLPPPEVVIPPHLPPILPNIPPFDIPDSDDENNAIRCSLQSLSFNKAYATVTVDIEGESHTTGSDTMVLTATGNGYFGRIKSFSSTGGLCTPRYSVVESRNIFGVTRQVYTITIDPVVFLDKDGNFSIPLNPAGVFPDSVRCIYEMCGKEYDATFQVNVVRHIAPSTMSVTYTTGVSVPPWKYDGSTAWYILPSATAYFMSRGLSEATYYSDIPAHDFLIRNTICSASGGGRPMAKKGIVFSGVSKVDIHDCAGAEFSLYACGTTDGRFQSASNLQLAVFRLS